MVLGLGGAVPLAAQAATAAPEMDTNAAQDAPVRPTDVGQGIDGQLSVELVLHNSGVVAADEPIEATLLLANRTEELAGAGEISFHIDGETIDTRYDLALWSNRLEPASEFSLGTEVFRAAVDQVHPGSTLEIPITLPDAATASLSEGTFGARGITVQWHTGDGVAAQGRSTLVWNAESLANPVGISPVVPIVTDLGQGNLLSIAELESLTAPAGDLTLLLNAVEGTTATLAIDPRLLVSVRALGADAPETAVDWLDRLQSLKNPSFPLEFADASLTLQQQAGLDQPLGVSGFTYATSQHEFFTEVEPEPTPTIPNPTDPGASATPGEAEGAGPTEQAEGQPDTEVTTDPAATPPVSPSPTDPEQTTPNTSAPEQAPVLEPRPAPLRDELLAFDYTRPELTWPAAGTVNDVGALTEWGAGAIILDGDQVTLPPDRSATPSSQHQISGTEVLITDTSIDAAIADAVTADDNLNFMDASTNLATILAVVARELPNEARQIVTTLPREMLHDPSQLGELLDQMEQNGWTEIDAIPDRAQDPSILTETELVPESYSPETIEQFQELENALNRGMDLSSLYTDQIGVAEELRVTLLGTIQNSLIQTDEWEAARAEFTEFATAAASQITIVEGSEIQLIGHESSLPLFIENSSDREVTVEVRLRPTTGHLTVTESAVVTIAPGGITRATLPVQAIANGVSGVEATLWTVTDVQLDNKAELVVNVNASLETVAVGLLIGAGVVLFVVGIWRTIRRRSRDKSAEVGESSDSTSASEAEGSEPEDTKDLGTPESSDND